ncbi:hypothetical protein BT69DRAFT_1285953 [Atractiella rhizophila]|nr:hypothetical protein BT69DRAFT_1285953 [Atractiella rhizophila]
MAAALQVNKTPQIKTLTVASQFHLMRRMPLWGMSNGAEVIIRTVGNVVKKRCENANVTSRSLQFALSVKMSHSFEQKFGSSMLQRQWSGLQVKHGRLAYSTTQTRAGFGDDKHWKEGG